MQRQDDTPEAPLPGPPTSPASETEKAGAEAGALVAIGGAGAAWLYRQRRKRRRPLERLRHVVRPRPSPWALLAAVEADGEGHALMPN